MFELSTKRCSGAPKRMASVSLAALLARHYCIRGCWALWSKTISDAVLGLEALQGWKGCGSTRATDAVRDVPATRTSLDAAETERIMER